MDKVKDVSNAIERYDRSHLFMEVKQLKLKPEKKQDSNETQSSNQIFSSVNFTAEEIAFSMCKVY